MGTFALVEGVEDGEEFVVGKGHNPLLFSNIYLFLSSLFISLEPGRLSGLLPFFLSGGLFCFVISIFLLFFCYPCPCQKSNYLPSNFPVLSLQMLYQFENIFSS